MDGISKKNINNWNNMDLIYQMRSNSLEVG